MGAAAVILALVIWWLGLTFVTVPLTLCALAAGLALGAVLSVIGYVRVCRGDEDEAAADPAADEGVVAGPDPDAPRGSRAPYPYWDAAWPGYLSWQVERDVVAAVAWPAGQVNRLITEARDAVRKAAKKQTKAGAALLVVLLPAAPAPVAFLAGTAAATYLSWAVLAAAVEGATAVPRLVRLGAIGALRAADSSVRWWRGTAVTCPRCRYVAWLPAYRCGHDRCSVVHRDIRPGRLGVWSRRCQCGAQLPTMVLRAARALTPACPNCDDTLRLRAGILTDARIVLSGGPAVGKTRLLVRAAAEMTGKDPSRWEPAEESTAAWLRAASPLASGRLDREAGEPALLTFCRRAHGRPQYFHIADVDGDHFTRNRDIPALWQLGATRRHLLVLDATVLPSVRDRIGSAGPLDRGRNGDSAGFAWSDISVARAELPYRLLVAQLNRLGVRTRRCSLALVITRADCLAASGLIPGQSPDGPSTRELRRWLRTLELHNLMEVAEHDFARVRWFLVGEGQAGSAAPFEWLLRQYPRGAATP